MQQHLLPISDAGLEQASTILCDTLLLAATQSTSPKPIFLPYATVDFPRSGVLPVLSLPWVPTGIPLETHGNHFPPPSPTAPTIIQLKSLICENGRLGNGSFYVLYLFATFPGPSSLCPLCFSYQRLSGNLNFNQSGYKYSAGS